MYQSRKVDKNNTFIYLPFIEVDSDDYWLLYHLFFYSKYYRYRSVANAHSVNSHVNQLKEMFSGTQNALYVI